MNIKKDILKNIYNQIYMISPELAMLIRDEVHEILHREHFEKRGEFREQFLIDVSQTAQADAGTGIQRVVNSLAKNILHVSENLIDIELIRMKRGARVVTARSYMNRLGVGVGRQEYIFYPGERNTLLLLDSSWDKINSAKQLISKVHEKDGRVLGVVYDLFPLQYPEFFESVRFRDVFSKWHMMLLEEADGIIGISRNVTDVISDYYMKNKIRRTKPLELYSFPMGADLPEGECRMREEVKAFFQTGCPVFLMVGTIEPRKGHAVAVEAFTKLLKTNSNAKLLIIGKEGWKNDDIIKLIAQDSLKGKILWIKDAADEELQWAYHHASALIAASKDEGFGLPIIEAAHHGIPIIASDIPIFHEVAGEYADYFKVMDSDDLCNVLLKWLETDIHPDSKKIRLYTWRDSAQVILDIMNRKQEPYRILR